MTWMLRGAAIWLLAGALAAAAPVAVRAELALLVAPASDLAGLVRGLAAAALVACGAWWWAATTAVLVHAARGNAGCPRGCPRGLHRLVMAAVGLGLAGGLGAPAVADGEVATPSAQRIHPVGGLPYPDRAELPTHAASALVPLQGSRHVVRPGDTLWAIAADELSPTATPAAIQARWQETYRLNQAVIGPDPDLLLPGISLELPSPVREETR